MRKQNHPRANKESSLKRLNVNIPSDYYRQLKVKASQNDKTISELINNWVERYLRS